MNRTRRENRRFEVSAETGSVSALLVQPADAAALYVLAHGAGAGMRHRFMDGIAEALCERGVATLRYQFPYAEAGRRRPDRAPGLMATVRAAVAAGAEAAPDLPLVAGGKSMGGRMTSAAQAKAPLPGVRALVFLGFPLHRPGDPSDARADHLADVEVPMLFVQGTRDRLAEMSRVHRVVRGLGNRCSLYAVQDGDHGFDVLKRTGRATSEVYLEIAGAVRAWLDAAYISGRSKGV